METKFIAPYLNAFYTSLLIKDKVDFSILKKKRHLAGKREQGIKKKLF